MNFECTFIPPDLSESSALEPPVAAFKLLMPWCDAGGGLFYNSNTVGSGDQNVSPMVQDVLSAVPPAAPLWFFNFEMPLSAFQIELFLPRSGTKNTGCTPFSYIQLRKPFFCNHSSTVCCFNCKIATSVMTMLLLKPLKFKQRVFISKIIHAAYTYTAEDVWNLITGGGDITKPTALIASYTPTTISVI